MQFLTNINLLQNEIQNVRLQQLPSNPANPVSGQIYFNTVDKRAYIFDGVDSWIGMDGIDATMSGADIITEINKANSGTINFARLSVTKSDLSLDQVTNDKQVKAVTVSIEGTIPIWANEDGDKLSGSGYEVDKTITKLLEPDNLSIPTSDAVVDYVEGLVSANEAMVYKGTLGSGGTVSSLPTTYKVGWAYKVISAGTYAGNVCEIGDLIIAIEEREGTGNQNSDWTVVQANIDGAVIGVATSTTNNFLAFADGNGKQIKDSGYSASDFSLDGHNHDTKYPQKYTEAIGDNSKTSFSIEHNLNTFDVVVSIRETASPYEIVYTDISIETKDKIKVEFAEKPTSNQYTVVVIG